jgi:acyl-CoA reductase-like NAD-dependent aldehyde dehydrogenase
MRTSYRSPGLLMANMSATVERSPVGVVGVIGPWNYPVFTPLGSIAYALAAGNSVVFKPSEYTPGVGQYLARTFLDATLFADVFICITGFGETGRYLCESGVDKLAFTGSTRTAKIVAATCAAQMTPVVLECGGKDPVIVAHDADIARAADATVWSAFSNAGQTCIGAERVYVDERVADKFIEKVLEIAKTIKPGAPGAGKYGPTTMPKQIPIIQSHIDDAIARGAKVLMGGSDSVKAPFVEPVILCDVPEDSIAMTDETFGPTIAINRVQSMAEAIKLSNDTRYGLGASVWSKRRGKQIASQLHTGMVAINSTISFAAVDSVPFGGVKDSGYGRIHGPEGLLEFTYPRTVVRARFQLPIAFTSFSRTTGSDKLIVAVTKFLKGRFS